MTAASEAASAGVRSSLGGEALGLVAAGIFVVFAVWVLVQRLRHGRGGDRHG
jgi:hypothetical protein